VASSLSLIWIKVFFTFALTNAEGGAMGDGRLISLFPGKSSINVGALFKAGADEGGDSKALRKGNEALSATSSSRCILNHEICSPNHR
jgi:hypothetical protein